MAGVLTQEKARRKRCQKRLEVEFCANNIAYRGVSENFSISGLFIKADNCLVPGSAVAIKVHLPDGSISTLKGRVTRVQRPPYASGTASEKAFTDGMGIEITERDSNYLKFFMSLVCDSYK